MARLSEIRYKRKSQQKSIKEDFLNFINSDDVKGFIGKEAQKDVYFIVDGYADAFIDKIKLPLLKAKEADFKTIEDLITKVPKYNNYASFVSDISGDCFYKGGLIEYLYWELLQIILDVLSMLKQKGTYSQIELGNDIQKALIGVKNKAEKWLNIKLDYKKAKMLVLAYDLNNISANDIRYEWELEEITEIEEYFKINLGIKIVTGESGEIIKVIMPKHRLTFQEITGIKLDDITLGLIISFLDFIAVVGYKHKIFFKNKITNEEKQPINEFLYQLNDVFGLGIKKEINDGLFVSLIIDGYFALQEKDEN